MELVSLKSLPKELKILLLKELGYETDGTYILKNGGWVYILEDFASSRFAVFCEKCLKKVRIIEID